MHFQRKEVREQSSNEQENLNERCLYLGFVKYLFQDVCSVYLHLIFAGTHSLFGIR